MSEETVCVRARIPQRLADIIDRESDEQGVLFEEICGKYVLAGIEASRFSEDKNKGG